MSDSSRPSLLVSSDNNKKKKTDIHELPGSPPPQGYQFWKGFAIMGAVGWFFEATALWPWWSHADLLGGSDPVFLYYLGHPLFSLFVGSIGLFQLIRVFMFSRYYYKQPDKNNMLELGILAPGVICMNFAIACIIWGSFSPSGITSAGLGFMVGAHAPAISFFFVAGAALIFLKKVFFDVGISYYQLWRIRSKYPNLNNRPALVQDTIDAIKGHIAFHLNFIPLWTAIVFAVLVCFTLPALSVAVPWWLATMGVVTIMATTAWYAFKMDIRDTWLKTKHEGKIHQIGMMVGIVFAIAACFVFSAVATIFMPWWAASLCVATLLTLTLWSVFRSDAKHATHDSPRSAVKIIHKWNGIGTKLKLDVELDSKQEKERILNQLMLLSRENNLSESEKSISTQFSNILVAVGEFTLVPFSALFSTLVFILTVGQVQVPIMRPWVNKHRVTLTNDALSKIHAINHNPTELLNPAEHQIKMDTPVNYAQASHSALKKIDALINQIGKGAHGLTMNNTFKTAEAWVKEVLGNNPQTDTFDESKQPAYFEAYSRLLQLFHFKAIHPPLRNLFKSTADPYYAIYETIAGHPQTLSNNNHASPKEKVMRKLGEIKVEFNSQEYRLVSLECYVSARIAQLRKQHAMGMRGLQWYRYDDPFAQVMTDLTARTITTLRKNGVHAILLNAENKAVNIPKNLSDNTTLTNVGDIPTIDEQTANVIDYLRAIAPGHVNCKSLRPAVTATSLGETTFNGQTHPQSNGGTFSTLFGKIADDDSTLKAGIPVVGVSTCD